MADLPSASRFPAPGEGPRVRTLSAWLIGLWLALALALLAGSFLWTRREKSLLVEQWEGRLSLAADDRASEIAQWLKERRTDAEVIAGFPTLREILRSPPESAAATEGHVREVFNGIAAARGYSAIWALDSDGNVRATSAGTAAPPAPLVAAARTATVERRITTVNLTSSSSPQRLILGLAAPILSETDGRQAEQEGVARGALLLTVDPARSLFATFVKDLFPMTRTDEMFIVIQSSGVVRCVSPLRLEKERSLSPAFAGDSDRVGAAALRSPRSFGEFTDYRGHRVFAATRYLPELRWGLVVKVDRDEAIDPLKETAGWVGLSAAGIFLAATGLGLSWRRRAVSERYRALAERDARYRLLFERNLAGVYRSTADGRLLECNEAFARVMGYASAEEALAQPAEAFHQSPEDREAFLERLRAEGNLANFESRARRRDGSSAWVLENVALIRSEEEGPEILQGTIIDISERKRAEEALRESEEKYRAILEEIQEGYFEVDLAGNFTSFNESLRQILGYPREELLGMNDRQYTDEKNAKKLFETFHLVYETGLPAREFDWEIIRKDGTRRSVEASVSLVRDPAGRPAGFRGLVHDITERKRAQEEKRRLEAQLAQSQKMEAVGRLAGGIAHDFNNLLTAISGYSELLLAELPPEEQQRGYVEEIRKAGQRAASLTQQLLAFSRRQILEPRVIDLNSVVTEIEEMLRRLIGEDIALRTRKAVDLWHVQADPGQIGQAIMNLVVNARDAMPQGGALTIETANVVLGENDALRRAPTELGSYAMIAVGDTGIGMGADVKARLFEPFFTTKEKGKGTGLGLSTTYGIIKQSNGYIWCDSEPGKGTTFKIYLPRVEEALEAEAPAPVPAPAEAVAGRETILLVEDEPEVRALVQKLLKMQGYTVLPAANPDGAIAVVRGFEGSIELMVSDVVMPGMSGHKLAERLAPLRPNMKVLYVSGYTDDAIVHDGILHPGTAFLPKPFTPRALARKVREVLDAPPEEFKVS